MYGWRGRVGIVSPSRGDTSLYEFYKVVPEGIMAVPTSLGVKRLATDQLAAVVERYQAAVQDLDYEECDVILLGGTPPVTSGDPGTERRLVEAAQAITKAKIFTGVQAELEALKAVGARRIAVGSPYTAELNDKWRRYFEGHGFQVAGIEGLGIDRNVELAKLPVYASYRLARRLFEDYGDVDAIHLTCPRWATLPNLARLEDDLGIPVTSSSQAQIYGSLYRLRVRDRIRGFGSLLESLSRLATDPSSRTDSAIGVSCEDPLLRPSHR